MPNLHENSILLVDDETEITTLVEQEARKLVTQVYVANSPTRAIEIAKKNRIDIAIIDLMMPEMSGFELISKLKTINASTTYIILSALNTKENIQEALRLSVCDFIEKPFSRIYLKISILRGLERHFYDDLANEILDLCIKKDCLTTDELKDLRAPSKRLKAIKKAFDQIRDEVLTNRAITN